MSNTRYHCCDEHRRDQVDAHATLNGLEAIEVIDRDLASNDPLRQRTLLLFFLKPITGAGFSRDNLRLSGGERVRDPRIEWAAVASLPPPQLTGPGEAATAALIAALPQPDQVLVVRVEAAGDYSSYTLRLVQGSLADVPPPGMDLRMAEIEFSFKAECPSEFDCKPEHLCPPTERAAPEIDYLARDYGTFRRLLLDRMASQVPQWRPGGAADGGIALVELLAYVGDQMAYRQDAIATEAYLDTARSRVSVRRHAQLVDYAMHDGCNARTFVHLRLRAGVASLVLPRDGSQFFTRCDRVPTGMPPTDPALGEALLQKPTFFEPLLGATLHLAHNQMELYTWSDEECCLPAGATRATLRGHFPQLLVGPEHPPQFLLFEEVRGPLTGVAGDADPTHRQVVRLTSVRSIVDALPNPAVNVTEIEWDPADALRFPLCLSSRVETSAGTAFFANISVARGNLVLADHGRTLPVERLPAVPASRTLRLAGGGAHCEARPARVVPPRYRPVLANGPLTQAAAPDLTSAHSALSSVVEDAKPRVTRLDTDSVPPRQWTAERNLLRSSPSDRHFAVEVQNDGRATLRFGDGRYGERPGTGTVFNAVYRVGNGIAGNIGADSLAHVVGADVSGVEQVRNPLAANGGVEPESIESVRRRAPEAFRQQQRAVTPADYTQATENLAGIDNAASRMRWTGSWHTMFVTVDRSGGAPVDDGLRAQLTRHLDGVRMAGHDLDIEEPVRVSLAIALHVCVKPEYFRADVKRALLELFSSGIRRDGQRGLFHPDNFSFGMTVYLSPLLAAAREVPGVASVQATAFGRQNDTDPLPLEDGRVTLGPREIARLDNDPNFVEHGVVTLDLHGGK